MQTEVCVGIRKNKEYLDSYKKYLADSCARPYPNETPELISTISYIVLNPNWRIPANIVKKEIYDKILEDPHYLDKKGYVVYRGNKIVDAHKIKWSKYNRDYLPFRFEQPPSDSNALGYIKFIFPNQFSVYLHDTRNRDDFGKQIRALTHGCVRVNDYLALAVNLLNPKTTITSVKDLQEYYGKRTAKKAQNGKVKVGNSGNITTNIFLLKNYPIWLDYRTAYVDGNDELQLFDDIYGKDATLLEIMQNAGVKEVY
jgi:murein L,D-transpeptidase YcbB/YkuD